MPESLKNNSESFELTISVEINREFFIKFAKYFDASERQKWAPISLPHFCSSISLLLSTHCYGSLSQNLPSLLTFDQVYNALGVSYVRDNKLDKGISQFETAVKLQSGYVAAWNNLGDAYEKREDLRAALKAFEEVLLFDPNNKVARPHEMRWEIVFNYTKEFKSNQKTDSSIYIACNNCDLILVFHFLIELVREFGEVRMLLLIINVWRFNGEVGL